MCTNLQPRAHDTVHHFLALEASTRCHSPFLWCVLLSGHLPAKKLQLAFFPRPPMTLSVSLPRLSGSSLHQAQWDWGTQPGTPGAGQDLHVQGYHLPQE